MSTFDKLVNMDWETVWANFSKDDDFKFECDDGEGYLQVCMSVDGDMHLWVNPHERGSSVYSPSVRARTNQGGGRHDRVREAMVLLALAIKEDNNNVPRQMDLDL